MKNKKLAIGLVGAGSLFLTACGGDIGTVSTEEVCQATLQDKTKADDAYQTVALSTCGISDAVWAYYDLDTGKLVNQNGGWDIAVKRDKAKVNPAIKSAVADEKTNFYDDEGKPRKEVFVNADSEVEAASFLALTDVNDDDYQASGVETAIKGDEWYSYDFNTHSLSAKTENFWVISAGEAEGGFAKMHASDITNYVATFSFYVQKSGAAVFNDSPVSLAVDLTEVGVTCYDFDAASKVDCGAPNWDVKFDIASRNYQVKLNGGASGSGKAKTVGPVSKDTYTSGNDEGLSYGMITDIESSAFSDKRAFEYNVTGDHTLYPNYRIYALNFGDEREPVKVQMTSYYGDNGASGVITMRYMSLSDNGQ